MIHVSCYTSVPVFIGQNVKHMKLMLMLIAIKLQLQIQLQIIILIFSAFFYFLIFTRKG